MNQIVLQSHTPPYSADPAFPKQMLPGIADLLNGGPPSPGSSQRDQSNPHSSTSSTRPDVNRTKSPRDSRAADGNFHERQHLPTPPSEDSKHPDHPAESQGQIPEGLYSRPDQAAHTSSWRSSQSNATLTQPPYSITNTNNHNTNSIPPSVNSIYPENSSRPQTHDNCRQSDRQVNGLQSSHGASSHSYASPATSSQYPMHQSHHPYTSQHPQHLQSQTQQALPSYHSQQHPHHQNQQQQQHLQQPLPQYASHQTSLPQQYNTNALAPSYMTGGQYANALNSDYNRPYSGPYDSTTSASSSSSIYPYSSPHAGYDSASMTTPAYQSQLNPHPQSLQSQQSIPIHHQSQQQALPIPQQSLPQAYAPPIAQRVESYGYPHQPSPSTEYASTYAMHGYDSEERPTRRRRGNLPKWATDYLKQWFYDHVAHPYPTEQEKFELCKITGLGMTQLSNWFINARRRQGPATQAQAQSDALARESTGRHSSQGLDTR